MVALGMVACNFFESESPSAMDAAAVFSNENNDDLPTGDNKTVRVYIAQKRKMYKGVSANVDFYSGFVYKILGLPPELYTPIFAVARIAGWSAHRIEELMNVNKIIRPAYMSISEEKPYTDMNNR